MLLLGLAAASYAPQPILSAAASSSAWSNLGTLSAIEISDISQPGLAYGRAGETSKSQKCKSARTKCKSRLLHRAKSTIDVHHLPNFDVCTILLPSPETAFGTKVQKCQTTARPPSPQPPPARRRPAAGRPAPWRRGSRRSGPVAERPVAGLPAVAARLAVRRPAGRRRDIARLCDFFASDIFLVQSLETAKVNYSACAAHRAFVGSRLSTLQKSTFALCLSHFCTFVLW